jgi:hypothetical protein
VTPPSAVELLIGAACVTTFMLIWFLGDIAAALHERNRIERNRVESARNERDTRFQA